MKANRKINYDGYLIQRGALGYYVMDWDWEMERDVAGPLASMEAAKRWVDRRNQQNHDAIYGNPSWVDMPR